MAFKEIYVHLRSRHQWKLSKSSLTVGGGGGVGAARTNSISEGSLVHNATQPSSSLTEILRVVASSIS